MSWKNILKEDNFTTNRFSGTRIQDMPDDYFNEDIDIDREGRMDSYQDPDWWNNKDEAISYVLKLTQEIEKLKNYLELAQSGKLQEIIERTEKEMEEVKKRIKELNKK